MSYEVKFTETTNPAKPALIVEDQSLNQATDLTFVGKNYAGYAPVLAENFLHLLENFAKTTAPIRPVQGQLWYDNTPKVNLLKIYDGTTWTAAGAVKKASAAPLVGNSTIGDIWVDTANQQMYLFSGSTWLLIGPQYSAGLQSGPIVETIIDINNVSQSVISSYSSGRLLSVISATSFTPKAFINGFNVINTGINLSSVDANSSVSPIKFWGTASQADALLVNGALVNSTNFLRADATVPSNVQLSIRSDNGINIGSDLNFSIRTDTSSTIFTSKTNGKSIDFKLNDQTNVLHLDSNSKVGINNTQPTEALDIIGNVTVSGMIKITGLAASDSIGIGSLITAGGISVAKKASFGGDLAVYGKLYVNNLNSDGVPVAGGVMLPGYTTSAPGLPLYDIGSTTQQFRNIYAQQFVGDFTGTFAGSLTGNISGSAAKLTSPTNFSLVGDVTSDTVSFDGQTQSGTAIFTTRISQDIITSKADATGSLLTDSMLIYRAGIGLRQTTKQSFIANIPAVPIGAMFPFAGAIPPNGYLLCDGSEKLSSLYADLFAIIGYTYKDFLSLKGAGTFGLPDLRGRFPLGRDNMDNNTDVPDMNNPNVRIDAGGGSANRVSSAAADQLGSGAGSESCTLQLGNLPDHKHNMRTTTAQYYAVGLPGSGTDSEAPTKIGMQPSTTTANGLRHSGAILAPENTTLGQAFVITNPYLTINYIIFTGKML